MSAATILEQQAYAQVRNAINGYSAAAQLAAAEATIRRLHTVLLALDAERAVYAPLTRRPVLAEAAVTAGAVQLQMRDLLDAAPADVLRHYRGEAIRAVADGLALAEHIDRLLKETNQ